MRPADAAPAAVLTERAAGWRDSAVEAVARDAEASFELFPMCEAVSTAPAFAGNTIARGA